MENVGYVNMFNRFIAAAVDPFINTGSGLDFGSGPGPVLYELLKQKGFTMTHYDPYFHDDKTVLTKTYDLITSTEVFEHLSNPLTTFKTLANMLNKDGVLAIMTSFHPQDDETFLSWWYRRDPTHIAFYTETTFKHLQKATKLQRIYTNHKNIIVFKK
jgi:cyclopropane fatty-acyl-phospholipid synthase-like methyltransferase